MTTLFCIRPATPNIGNDLINRATLDLLFDVFGADLSVVNLPAIASQGRGGLTASQIYDINRFADGVVLGGGNLFENGQVTVDPGALEAMRKPLMLMGLSHGRIYDEAGDWTERSDSLAPAVIRRLIAKADVAMVRDAASARLLAEMDAGPVEMAGCPTTFMEPNDPRQPPGDQVLLSIRHPQRMSVTPSLQWRTAQDVRRLIDALRAEYGAVLRLVCHDYLDLEFAAGFPDTPSVYFDTVERYADALRRCRLNVTYRLHAFLPCLAFGTHSIHMSYDERGKAMVATAGMGDWDIDLMREADPVAAVMARARAPEAFAAARQEARADINHMRAVTLGGVRRFFQLVEQQKDAAGRQGQPNDATLRDGPAPDLRRAEPERPAFPARPGRR
ncbi:MAG: polysaccharide pyruvyl transferase family protein [Caulobacter sp.]